MQCLHLLWWWEAIKTWLWQREVWRTFRNWAGRGCQTLLQVLLLLGPLFVLDVPNSLYMFPYIDTHITHKVKHYCDAGWVVVESGCLKYIITATLSPLYICFMFSYLRNRIPRIFARLIVGMSLFLIGFFSILISDVGHAHYEHRTINHSVCLILNLVRNLAFSTLP